MAVVKARSHEILGETKWHKYIYYYEKLLLLGPRSGAVYSGVVTET